MRSFDVGEKVMPRFYWLFNGDKGGKCDQFCSSECDKLSRVGS